MEKGDQRPVDGFAGLRMPKRSQDRAAVGKVAARRDGAQRVLAEGAGNPHDCDCGPAGAEASAKIVSCSAANMDAAKPDAAVLTAQVVEEIEIFRTAL